MRRTRAPADAPAPEPAAATSPAIAVTGFLMLLTVLLTANAWFGSKMKEWPWEVFVNRRHSTLVSVIFAVWVVTGFWAILTSLTHARRVRAIGLTVLTVALLTACTGRMAGFVIETYNLDQMLAMILLGGGLLAARDPSTRGLGRLLAGIGTIALVWLLAASFPGQEGLSPSRLELWWRDMGILLDDWSAEFESPNHVWWSLIPQLLVLLAAVGGLLAAFGLTERRFLLVTYGVLLVGLLFPLGTGIALVVPMGAGMSSLVAQVTEVFVAHGFLLWLLGAFVVVDLARVRVHGP